MKMMRLRGPNGLLPTVTIASATTRVATILVHQMYVLILAICCTFLVRLISPSAENSQRRCDIDGLVGAAAAQLEAAYFL